MCQMHTVNNVRILHIVHDAGDMKTMGEVQRGGGREEEEDGEQEQEHQEEQQGK